MNVDKALASIPPLSDDNWHIWKPLVQSVLHLKGIPRFSDLDLSRPADLAHDKNAHALITLSVGTQHLPLVVSASSGKEAFAALEALYSAQSSARIMQLNDHLAKLSKSKSETVLTYCNRAKQLQQDLAAAGQLVADTQLLASILRGLPDEYNVIRTFLKTKTTLTYPELLNSLMSVEQEVKSDNSALAAGPSRSHAQRNPHRGKHNNNNRTKGSNVTCTYCHYQGHTEDECRRKAKTVAELKAARQSPSHKPAHGQPSSTRPPTALMATRGDEHHPSTWAIDSGATWHISPHQHLFTSYSPLSQPMRVKLGDGHTVEAASKGDIQLYTELGGNLILQDVLYIPDFAYNLFSIRQASSHGATTNFNKEHCTITINGEPLLQATSSEGLYLFQATYPKPGQALAATVETPELWHRRLGHLGYDNLSTLVNNCMVKGIRLKASQIKPTEAPHCESCAAAKQPRRSFPSSGHAKITAPLDLLHSDVMGPMPEGSRGGNKYIVTILDDFSGFSAIVPLATKAEAPSAVQRLITYLQTQTGRKVKAVRTDRGGEYMASTLQKFFTSNGIQHQTSAPYTPEQNGSAERLNRTLLDRCRAMLHDSQLSLDLWAEAIVTANYIRNRSPTHSRDKTPWELMFGEQPDLSHMRVFGSKAYVHHPRAQRNKLDPTSRTGVFVGYEPGSKAYRILMDDNSKVEVSSSVHFNEVPRHASQPDNSSIQQLPLDFELLDLQPEPAVLPELPEAATSDDDMEYAHHNDRRRPREQETESPRSRAGRPLKKPQPWWALAAQVIEPNTYEQALATGNPRWVDAMERRSSHFMPIRLGL